MSNWKRGCMLVSLLALGGCGFEAQSGRLVGFVVNGQTGERMNFFKSGSKKPNVGDDADSQSQVYGLINGEFRRARPCGTGDMNDKNAIQADGCYQIDGIPEGMTFPLIAQAPGFERFYAEVTYPLLEVDYEQYQFVGNIRMFPMGFAVDYRILVNFAGQPVAGAKVACQWLPQTNNTLQTSGSFLTPQNTGSTTVVATTDAQGVAQIPGAQLVNGAAYRCESVVEQPYEGRVLSGDLTLTAGVSQANQSLALGTSASTDNTLYAVSSSVDNANGPQGQANAKLVITFNRPVEIMPGTTDCQQAFIITSDVNNNGLTANTVTNVPNDPGNVSETVATQLSADGLELTVSLKPLAQPFDSGDLSTYVAFTGIAVHPKSTVDARQVRYIGSVAGCPQAQVYGTESPLRNTRLNGNQPSTVLVF